MRGILFLITSLAFTFALNQASSQTVDSLQRALAAHLTEDSTRLNLLLDLSTKSKNYFESSEAVEKAILLAKKLGLRFRLGQAYIKKAAIALDEGYDTLAEMTLPLALSTFQQEQSKEGEGLYYRGMARVFQFRSDYHNAIEYNNKALSLFAEVKNIQMMGSSNLDIGVCYYFLADYVRANEFYLAAKKYYEKSNDAKSLMLVINNLAMINREQKKYATAIALYRTALDNPQKVKDSSAISKLLQGIGITYDLMLNSDSAIWYYKLALGINRRNNFSLGIAENLTNLGISYNDIHQYTVAYQYYMESLQLFKILNRPYNISQLQTDIAELYINAPDSFFSRETIPIRERYIRAIVLLKNTITRCEQEGTQDTEQVAWNSLSGAYAKVGNYKKAYEAITKAMLLKDSILNEEKIEATTLQNARADFDKKEAVLLATHEVELIEQKKVKYALAGGVGLLLIGGSISFAFYKRKRDALSKQRDAELNAEISDTEMKALRAQMNPHFIFNSLNSISDYIAKNNIGAADEYLTKFARLMRMILENSEKKEVSLVEDLKALELYMQLESLRMRNKFVYEINVDESIDKENTLVPPLLLQPFVENSIWHGIAQKEGTGKILVTIKREKEMISCIVEDDGIGRDRAIELASSHPGAMQKSLGMKITKARIDVMNKVKKSEAFIHLSDLAKGTRVEVQLPLELSL